jgi:DNA-binding transcriptional LysR family regulator
MERGTDGTSTIERVLKGLPRPPGLLQKPTLVPRLAAKSELGPKLAKFARNYPDVKLDVSTDETRLDLVASGFESFTRTTASNTESHFDWCSRSFARSARPCCGSMRKAGHRTSPMSANHPFTVALSR